MDENLTSTSNSPPVKKSAFSKRSFFFKLILYNCIWLLMLVKIFVYDFDVYLFNKFFKEYTFLIEYKFFFFTLFLGLLIYFWRSKNFVLNLLFFISSPLILFFMVSYKILTSSASTSYYIINSSIIFFAGFKFKILNISLYLFSIFVILTSDNYILISSFACFVIIILALSIVKKIIIKNPLLKFQDKFEEKINASVGEMIIVVKGDEEFSQILKESKSDKELWNNLTSKTAAVRFQMTAITQTILSFIMLKLNSINSTKIAYMYAFLMTTGQILLTIISFALINYALYKTNPINFLAENVNLIDFLLYSALALFNTDYFLIKPITQLSSFLYFSEVFLGTLILAFFIVYIIRLNKDYHKQNIDKIRETCERNIELLNSKCKAELRINLDNIIEFLRDNQIGLFYFVDKLLKSNKK